MSLTVLRMQASGKSKQDNANGIVALECGYARFFGEKHTSFVDFNFSFNPIDVGWIDGDRGRAVPISIEADYGVAFFSKQVTKNKWITMYKKEGAMQAGLSYRFNPDLRIQRSVLLRMGVWYTQGAERTLFYDRDEKGVFDWDKYTTVTSNNTLTVLLGLAFNNTRHFSLFSEKFSQSGGGVHWQSVFIDALYAPVLYAHGTITENRRVIYEGGLNDHGFRKSRFGMRVGRSGYNSFKNKKWETLWKAALSYYPGIESNFIDFTFSLRFMFQGDFFDRFGDKGNDKS